MPVSFDLSTYKRTSDRLDTEITTFLTLWNHEEFWRARPSPGCSPPTTSRLAAEAQHPLLDELLRRRVRALWSPVGASVMPEEETQHLVRSLFSGPEGVAMADRIDRVDRRVDGLPGLAGLDLMAGARARYG